MKFASFALGAAVAALLTCSTAGAQESAENYPSKPITIVVSYTPGGFNDQVARLLSEDLSNRWNQTVIVDNRPGGGTVVGTDVVAKAEPDGYTLGIAPFAFAVNPGLFPQLPYDSENDFTNIAILGGTFNVLAANPEFPVNNVQELIDYAKAHPGEINYGSAGNGSSNHLSAELLKSLTDTDMVHIPYKGSAPARTDLIAGRVDVMFDNFTNFQSLIEAGQLKALGVSIPQESKLLPGVPPISDTVPNYEVTVWWGLNAPAGVPEPIVEKINTAVNEFLQKDKTIETFANQGVDPIGGTPAEAEAYVKEQMETWIPVAKKTQMQVD
ncbi:tripartite tricarboxylate transporter substrate binding protein [Jiella avicenniae]|uniref:Tripartite tricarboxylate transporter substrate binding protein n=1 Tax=Jiella avicenniae TaxID=2907202 RepID=A0A9X1T5L2_9HYPH|nr:tripartite tricarboxylate transporter substrate binding protein [Jiella avicenniae]MCE7029681.1 tripartite tricarboxylate transporter substrate binding protein [Jiella avicenniae]